MNSIELAKSYVPLLDEVYKNACLTADLDGNPELVREGANANELVIPKLSMDGLANYSRNGGYVGGDVTITHETVACNFDRGRMFNVDVMDNLETALRHLCLRLRYLQGGLRRHPGGRSRCDLRPACGRDPDGQR